MSVSALALISAGTLVVANSATAASASTKASKAPLVLKRTLVFGVIATDSGPDGVTNDTPKTAHAWEAYVNAHGGINGHRVDVIVEDDAGNAATGLQDAQTLIKTDHAIAIGDNSYDDAAFQKYVDGAKVPVISLGANQFSYNYVTDKNDFASGPTLGVANWSLLDIAKLAGATKYATFYCAEVAACATSIPIETRYGKALKVPLVYSAPFSASAPNYTALCLASQSKRANALFIAGVSELSDQRVLDNCAAQHYHPIAIEAVGTLPDAANKDPNIPLIWGQAATVPPYVKSTALTLFDHVMRSYLPSAVSQQRVLMDWAGLKLFAAAAAHIGATPTAAAIYNGLYALKNTTLGGITPKLNFKKGKPNQVNCFFVYKVKRGVVSQPEGARPVCATAKQLAA
jgi:branched-chain amino acid transport system substrate-binding protein